VNVSQDAEMMETAPLHLDEKEFRWMLSEDAVAV
jgi:hypothetical protein